MTLDNETLEKALEGKSEINRRDHIKRIIFLMKRAEPGNYYWRCLENEYFGPGDYQESDMGEPPEGANW